MSIGLPSGLMRPRLTAKSSLLKSGLVAIKVVRGDTTPEPAGALSFKYGATAPVETSIVFSSVVATKSVSIDARLS